MTGFRTCSNKGFHITFENGVTVSVQFGFGNYGTNYNLLSDIPQEGIAATEAETAIFDAAGEFIKLPGHEHDVAGYQTPAQVLETLVRASKL